MLNLSEIKNLSIHAKNRLNSLLSLKRSKKIKYDDKHYFDLISFLSLWNSAGKSSSQVMNIIDDVPNGDALMKQLQKLSIGEVESQFDNVFERQFKKIFKKKKKPKVVAIIDVHEQETYTKEKRTSDDVRGGKHKNGTNFFFKFATLQIIFNNKVHTMKVLLHRRDQTLKSVVEKLVKHAQKFVKIKVLLLDRGFRDVKIFNELEFIKVPVIMPCIKDDKTKEEFAKSKKRFEVVKYYWRNIKGEYSDFKLVMIKLSNDKEIGFYTTISFARLRNAKYFINLYRMRWNIETSYRVQKDFLPKTTCIKGVVRYFYFCYSVAMHNLWLCLRASIGKSFGVLTLKFLMIYFWITTHINPEL